MKFDVAVHETKRAGGYIGPCEYLGCDNPAVVTLKLNIADVIAYCWTCETHRKLLVPGG